MDGESTFEELLILSAINSTKPLSDAFFVPGTEMLTVSKGSCDNGLPESPQDRNRTGLDLVHRRAPRILTP